MRHVKFKLWDWEIIKKKLAKIGHFNNDKSFSRLSSEFDINVKLELRWRLKIILTNNIVANIYLIWWITSCGILKKEKMTFAEWLLMKAMPRRRRRIEERGQGSRKILKCLWEGAEYDHMWS